MYEGKTYYYGLTTYFYTETPEFTKDHILISPMKRFSATCQEELPGTRYPAEPGDLLEVTPENGSIEVLAIDPSVITGHEYEISFHHGNDDEIYWNVEDVNEDFMMISNQIVTASLDESNAQPIFHGLQVKVAYPVEDISQIYRFGTSAIESSKEIAKDDVSKINVFPNPYYAHNDLATDRYSNFVTFTHLPERAEIRIFNLAGIQLRVIRKNDPSQFLKWNLCNEKNFQVGSGIYIVRIYLPDLKKTKILKICVVQKELGVEYF